MNFSIGKALKRVLPVVALLVGLVIDLEAQNQRPARISSPPRSAAELLILRIDALTDATAAAEIVRRPRGEHRNVILVSDVTTARDLAMAIRSFRMMRDRVGDKQTREFRGVIQPASSRVQFSPFEIERAESVLLELSSSRTQIYRGLGSGRGTKLTVPAAKASREAAP